MHWGYRENVLIASVLCTVIESESYTLPPESVIHKLSFVYKMYACQLILKALGANVQYLPYSGNTIHVLASMQHGCILTIWMVPLTSRRHP